MRVFPCHKTSASCSVFSWDFLKFKDLLKMQNAGYGIGVILGMELDLKVKISFLELSFIVWVGGGGACHNTRVG